MSARVFKKSVLLKTSSNADVQCGGGLVAITGLRPVPKKDIASIIQVKYRVEVPQVVLVGGVPYTPQSGTTYKVWVYDLLRVAAGYMEVPKPYAYTTPADVTTLGSVAAQKEFIHGKLVTAINNATGLNHAVAASLGGGTGFTVTDQGGYFPVRAQNMANTKGINSVTTISTSEGNGFAFNNVSITTVGVYSAGVGAKLALEIPVVDLTFGNLISGILEGPFVTATNPPTAAISGQNYDIFQINSVKWVPGAGLTEQYVYQDEIQAIAVDNGTGNSAANLAGFLTFEREMRKLITQTYSLDQQAMIQWMDQGFLEQAPQGAAPSGTSAASNTFLSPYGALTHYQIGTNVIVTATQGASGLLIEQTTTAALGAAYFPSLSTVNSQQFIVGKSGITVNCKASFTTPANIVFMVGLRAKEAANQGFATNIKNALIGTGAAGTFFATYGALATASTVTTTSAVSALTAVQYDFRIQVAIDGTVTAFANNVSFPIYSAGTTPLVFAAGTVLTPHLQYTNLNSAAAVPNVSEFWAVSSNLVIS